MKDMTPFEKTMLSIAGLIMVAAICMGTLPVGYYQAPVTQFTNDFTVYFAAGDPTTTNNWTYSGTKCIQYGNGITTTNNGTLIVSNQVTRGYSLNTPVYANISTPTNNNYSVANTSLIIITNCSTNALYFTGFAGGVSGQQLRLINLTATNMFIGYTNVLSAGNNQVNMMGLNAGTYTNTVGQGSITVVYDGATTNWLLTGITY
jgi:hypothetical protein